MIATSTADKNTLFFKSPFLNAEIEGKYKLTTIADAITNSFSTYYNPTFRKQAATAEQQLRFKIAISDSPILVKFIPELKSLEPIFRSTVNDSIVLNAAIPKLVYGSTTITNAVFKIDTKEDALVYNLVVDDIQNSQSNCLLPPLLERCKTIRYTLQLKDVKDVERLALWNAKSRQEIMSLDPTKLLLNYESWKVDADNLVRFGTKGIYANNLELSKAQSSIRYSHSLNRPMLLWQLTSRILIWRR
jgi:hypothetical protein